MSNQNYRADLKLRHSQAWRCLQTTSIYVLRALELKGTQNHMVFKAPEHHQPVGPSLPQPCPKPPPAPLAPPSPSSSTLWPNVSRNDMSMHCSSSMMENVCPQHRSQTVERAFCIAIAAVAPSSNEALPFLLGRKYLRNYRSRRADRAHMILEIHSRREGC